MRLRSPVKESPFREICKEEWIRAKSIIRFSRQMPKFVWSPSELIGGRCHARCWRNSNMIEIRKNYLYADLTDPLVNDEFRKLLRHEFAHFVSRGHGEDFKYQCERLGGTRWVSSELSLPAVPRKEKKVVVKENIDFKATRFQKVLLNVRKYETKLKRDKTLLSKWQKKVKYYRSQGLESQAKI